MGHTRNDAMTPYMLTSPEITAPIEVWERWLEQLVELRSLGGDVEFAIRRAQGLLEYKRDMATPRTT